MKRTILFGICSLLTITSLFAQNTKDAGSGKETATSNVIPDKLKNLSVSGYIQGQYQNGQSESISLNVGDPVNEDPGEKNISRMGIRRGRIKFAYEEDIYMGVFQLDITEKGVNFKDIYFQVKDPWVKTSFAKAGVFDRPFGYEISYSSSRRESPERSEVFQKLFPDERDLGFAFTLQAPKTSALRLMKLEAGWFAGNGIRIDSDNRKDFIGHLKVADDAGKNFAWGVGFSYYNGGVFNPTDKLYEMNGTQFVAEAVKEASYAKREYFGFDGQVGFRSALGKTLLRAEYLWGTQPGTFTSSRSPNYSTRAVWKAEVTTLSDGLYLRDFSGYYVHLVQGLGKTPFSLTLKYDYYDPNTDIEGKSIGVGNSNTSSADLALQTWGFGALWDVSKSFRVMAYYDVRKNEEAVNSTSEYSSLYNHDREDNVFTLRLQYKF